MPDLPPTPSTDPADKPAVPEAARGMGESNMIDPTPGWVPFVVVIGLGVVLVFAFVLAAILIP
ncbi:MAG: hypothetical protein ACIAXF_07675 [Phycisphaerales bacterium JB063]